MSCHDIGLGMDSVVEVIVRLYDQSRVSRDAAVELIHAARKGVNWCDGNEYEAIASIEMSRCGRCLKTMQDGYQRILDNWVYNHYWRSVLYGCQGRVF